MTKEELKQEAEEYAEGMAKYYASTHEDCIPSQFEKYLRNAYITSAEPREKQIEIDAEQIRALQKQNGELTDKVNELEQQIEKMKQCGNCGNGTIGNCEHCKRKPKQKSTDTADYWRLKEIKENG